MANRRDRWYCQSDGTSVVDIFPKKMKDKYSIILTRSESENQENLTKIGYFKIDKL